MGAPSKFVYVKKISQNNRFPKFKKDEYTIFKKNLNTIKIDDISNNININSNKNINCNIDDNDKIDEDIKSNYRVSYIEKFKTLEEIEKKIRNMNKINKIINNNLTFQTININGHNFLYSDSEEQYYKDLKTATFALCENEN